MSEGTHSLAAERVVVEHPDTDGHPRAVLNGVCFETSPGSLTAITGASGSGKSTLLSVLSGIARPKSGRLMFDGADLLALPDGRLDRWRRRTIGLVFQNFHLIEELGPVDNVRVAAWFDRWSATPLKARASDLLEDLGVPAGRKTLKGMSRGERQRVAIARALLFDPPIVLADEPTASLDRDASMKVVEILRREASLKGRNVVVVTHDPALVAVADVVFALRGGHLLPAQEKIAK